MPSLIHSLVTSLEKAAYGHHFTIQYKLIDTDCQVNYTNSVLTHCDNELFISLITLYKSNKTVSTLIQPYNNNEIPHHTIEIIKKTFINLNSDTFLNLYKALIRPQLEYANEIWLFWKLNKILEHF